MKANNLRPLSGRDEEKILKANYGHNYYNDRYGKENQYERNRKNSDPLRREDSNSRMKNNKNNISNIVEGVEKKINEVMNQNKPYGLDNFEVNYPYGGGVGGIP